MKNLCLVILIATLGFCACIHKHSPKTHNDTAFVRSLKKKKDAIDKLLLRDTDSLRVFVKMTGKDQLLKILNNDFPENDVECTYNVLKVNGRVLMIAELPYSESGDWIIAHKHYFDTNGNTFVFTKDESRFTDQVPGGMLWEKLVTYYDGDFNIVHQVNKLIDNNNRPVAGKKNEYDLMDDVYKVYKNADACLNAYHIDCRLK